MDCPTCKKDFVLTTLPITMLGELTVNSLGTVISPALRLDQCCSQCGTVLRTAQVHPRKENVGWVKAAPLYSHLFRHFEEEALDPNSERSSLSVTCNKIAAVASQWGGSPRRRHIGATVFFTVTCSCSKPESYAGELTDLIPVDDMTIPEAPKVAP
jgi:hypothetical protein